MSDPTLDGPGGREPSGRTSAGRSERGSDGRADAGRSERGTGDRSDADRPDGGTDDRTDGRFGPYGGQFVPEVLVPALDELTGAYERYVLGNEDGFRRDLEERLASYGGRPTPVTHAAGLSERYGIRVDLKREDLLHGGAHKLNNALGQCLLARYMGKDRVIAETGAGQHGTATAMAAAALDLECVVYMGRTDVRRQRANVHRMELLGATVEPVDAGTATLKEAINATLRDWIGSVESTHYAIGSVVGPHPYPALVREFQSVISAELCDQIDDRPDAVVACAGGGSNAMGAFDAFLDEADVDLYAVEAGGERGLPEDGPGNGGTTVAPGRGERSHERVEESPHAAALAAGEPGVLHGARTRVLQDPHGRVSETDSVSAGLDYAAVGPQLAHLVAEGRVDARAVPDAAALRGARRLAETEGILPALESAHALGLLEERGAALGDHVVVVVSGRGDKDLEGLLEGLAGLGDLELSAGDGGGPGQTQCAGQIGGDEP